MYRHIVLIATSALLVVACATAAESFQQEENSDQYGAYQRSPLDDVQVPIYEEPEEVLEPRNWHDTCQGESTWRNWGAAPYAATDSDAFSRLPEALVALGIPEELHGEFIQLVQENPDGLAEMRITADHDLIAMMSGESDRPVMCNPTVADIPVNQSGSIVQAARARVWTIEYEGEVFTLVLPEICRNWAWLVEPAQVIQQAAPQEECAMILYPAEYAAEVRHFLWSRTGSAEYSSCYALIQGDEQILTNPPSPCTDCVPGRLSSYLRRNFDVGQIVERNSYTARYDGAHVLVVPMSRLREHTTICVDPAGSARLTSATVEPLGFYGGDEISSDQDDWIEYPEGQHQILAGVNEFTGERVLFRIRAMAVIPSGAFQTVR